ncbi:MAG: outer membrane protein transport protein [Tannerella sp.]|jgi:hypothetical protein|nr:outer membrane protein transport protein [Tannerella sp.]
MKKYIYISALLFISSGVISAQGEMDAYRFTQTDLNGTARSMSMGGAFGALGGDMSSMSHNPAGLGVYRSSEVQTTLDLNMSNIDAAWTNIKNSENKTRFSFDNFSYVGYYPTGRDEGLKTWNIGFSYNKVKNFNRKYRAYGRPVYSMADYAASRATNAYKNKDGGVYGIPENDLIYEQDQYNPYNNRDLNGEWLSILGYGAGFFGAKYGDLGLNDVYHSAFGEWKGNTWSAYSPDDAELTISERGSIDEFNISLSTNISDRVFIGATVSVTDVDYQMSSDHYETFGSTDDLYLDNDLETEGTGYSFNVGVIARPIDAIRLGVAYNSPKWYKMTDYYRADAGTYIAAYSDEPEMYAWTPDAAYTEYRFRTPGRWIFSAAGFIGTTALVSVDYELTDYTGMYLSDREGYAYTDENSFIKEDFKSAQTLKLGTEVKITPQFAVRAGYIWQPSPMKSHLINGTLEVRPMSTIPHYSVSNTTNYYTVGLGYRFTPNFYMDLACVYRIQDEKLYPFSNMGFNDPDNYVEPVEADPIKISAKTTRLALTFGYKF